MMTTGVPGRRATMRAAASTPLPSGRRTSIRTTSGCSTSTSSSARAIEGATPTGSMPGSNPKAKSSASARVAESSTTRRRHGPGTPGPAAPLSNVTLCPQVRVCRWQDLGYRTRVDAPEQEATPAGDWFRADQAPFRAFLESAPDAVVIIGPDGHIAFVNAQTERLFGFTRDELLGQPVETLLPDCFRSAHTRHRDNYRSDPPTRPMGAGLELFGRRKTGDEFPVDISLSPLPTDHGVLLTAAIRDMTERKRAEEARALLATVVESSDDAIFAKTIDGTILSWNRGAERMYGYSADEAIGMSVAELAPPDRKTETEELLSAIARGERVEQFETVRVRHDGTLR